MDIVRETIDFIFGAALFFNALLFIPQIIKILRTKTSEGVSLVTFSGFLIIQIAIIFHAIAARDHLLFYGYTLSFLACGSVLILALIYRKKDQSSPNDFELSEIIAQLPGHIYWKDTKCTLRGSNTNNWKDFGLKSLKDFIGKTDYDLFPKEQADKIRAIDTMVINEGKSSVIEEESIKEGKEEIIYLSYKVPLKNKKGDIVGLIGYSIDITEAKKKALNQLAVLDNIISVMPGNVYWMNKEGVYLGCNDNEARSVGLCSRKDIVGKRNIDIPGFVVPEALDPINQEVMQYGKPLLIEEPAILKDGTHAVFLSNKVPLHDLNNNIIGLLGISIDITEKKKTEQELLAAKEAAESANRAKTEFLANMSHDVKTPLTGVIGMADLMIQDLTGQDRQRAEAIYACGMQLVGFFNSCLDLSKLEMLEWASNIEVFSLEKLLHEIDAMFSPAAQTKGLAFSVEYDFQLPKILRGHRASVYRVLLNLVGNALKFTPSGGKIHVRAFLALEGALDSIQVGLEVKDTGIGIPSDQYGVIFEKLRRLTPAYEGKVEGSGIGLYIVDQYVKRMGGSVRVESTVGKGSTFTVFLPMNISSETALLAQEEVDDFVPVSNIPTPRAEIPVEQFEGELPENAPHILLVEDNSLIQRVTQMLLNGTGFSVDVAGTGAEAIEKFSPGKYGLVYMDIGLPDMDGYAVTQAMRLKEQQQAISPTPIVALTAHGAIDVERFCSRVGMQGVLSKPLTREQAEGVWARYGLGRSEKVEGLTVIEYSKVAPLLTEVIDIEGTAALLGTKERAAELLALWFELLTHRFLPALHDLIEKQDIEGLRHELHNMLGSLCYVKTPLLHQAVLELQTAARDRPHEIENGYQRVLEESKRFVKQYQQQL